jgi:hypothetical protein
VAGTVLSDFARPWLQRNHRIKIRPLAIAAISVLAVFVGIRGTDLVTDRTYVMAAETTVFGAGPSWWYPERAAEFVRS